MDKSSGFGNTTGIPISEGVLYDNTLYKDLLDSVEYRKENVGKIRGDIMDNTKIASELLRIAKGMLGMEFDTKEEMEQYKKDHDVRPVTKMVVKNSPAKQNVNTSPMTQSALKEKSRVLESNLVELMKKHGIKDSGNLPTPESGLADDFAKIILNSGQEDSKNDSKKFKELAKEWGSVIETYRNNLPKGNGMKKWRG